MQFWPFGLESIPLSKLLFFYLYLINIHEVLSNVIFLEGNYYYYYYLL